MSMTDKVTNWIRNAATVWQITEHDSHWLGLQVTPDNHAWNGKRDYGTIIGAHAEVTAPVGPYFHVAQLIVTFPSGEVYSRRLNGGTSIRNTQLAAARFNAQAQATSRQAAQP